MGRTLSAVLALALGLSLTAAPRAWAKDEGNAAPKVNASNKPDKQSNPPQRATLDLNTASKDELKTLPGIGETFSKRIIDNRPYKDKRELTRRNVLPEGVYNKIKERVTAVHEKAKPVTTKPTQ